MLFGGIITIKCRKELCESYITLDFVSRLLNPVYIDGISEPRRGITEKDVPNPRFVSGSLTKFDEVLHNRYTMAVLQWGQFLEQDLSRPALSPMCKRISSPYNLLSC